MRQIKYIVLHHSATDVYGDGSVLADAIMSNQRRKWIKDFPNYVCDYHYMVGPTGKIFKGQPEEFPGWHATNYVVNLESIGVCFLGNFEKSRMQVAQFDAGVKLLKDIVKRYDIKSENVVRHKDVISDETGRRNSTLCPGKYFPYEEMLNTVFAGTKGTENDYLYKDVIQKLNELGIIVGDGNSFRPKDPMTREEGFLIAYRILKLLKAF
ncbi:N-acetylmuramoyl-L-alanine amidase [Caldisericum exile]|uniref:N-acetylmuramoyl-L-alanine amidase n=1 Tax=Caldisericum exile (strain DSM 21853 / NBRC 104410 / AZM16c01) TaxID=511051 RepID=A0A7U6GFN5_CALEA|nr:N-acetylmuramoyl-L-alanine amidase [Caldisericum exile]BAL81533.1 putative N-acetylmuramoyl-L-alanine amidase [Caldisericum exile AZM16c01]